MSQFRNVVFPVWRSLLTITSIGISRSGWRYKIWFSVWLAVPIEIADWVGVVEEGFWDMRDTGDIGDTGDTRGCDNKLPVERFGKIY